MPFSDGKPCVTGSDCASTYCSGGVCCNKPCLGCKRYYLGTSHLSILSIFRIACQQCDVTPGICSSFLDGAQCFEVFDCSTLVSGWVNNACHRYNGFVPGGNCASGNCNAASSLCAWTTTNVPTTPIVDCVSSDRINPFMCWPFQLASQVSVSTVCKNTTTTKISVIFFFFFVKKINDVIFFFF